MFLCYCHCVFNVSVFLNRPDPETSQLQEGLAREHKEKYSVAYLLSHLDVSGLVMKLSVCAFSRLHLIPPV